ncbi:MAG: indole-3-glycerol phosphate synthase TrpC [Anaerolineae bacterium]|jgi:indole-3-glycerol phosphate synthase
MILDEIMAHKRQELEGRRRAVPLAELKTRGADQPAPLDFASALQGGGVRLIAEIKHASPSKGLLCPNFDPLRLATTYATHGAAAISILTDEKFFQGELDYLGEIANICTERSRKCRKSQIANLQYPIPLLRKDFIFDAYQVHETFAHGADALLLIAAVLSDEALDELLALTHELGMAALVEVHDEEEVARVLRLRPRIVGINNRNLQDFSVDLATFGRLRSLLPPDVVAVAESGVHTASDVRCLATMGADAVLVGEALVTAPDVAAKVRELAGIGD